MLSLLLPSTVKTGKYSAFELRLALISHYWPSSVPPCFLLSLKWLVIVHWTMLVMPVVGGSGCVLLMLLLLC